MNKSLIIGAIIVVVVAASLYYFLVLQKQGPTVAPLEGERGFGSELFEKAGNPAQIVPDANPFEDIDTNPLQGINPFGEGYQNPFGE
jgi:flagellar basal body-associated protein FliL